MPDVWHAQRIVLVAPKRVEHNEFLHDRVHEQSTLVQRSRISDRPRGGRNPCVWYVFRDNDGWRLEWLYATIPQYVLCALHWVFPYLNCVEIPFLDMA